MSWVWIILGGIGAIVALFVIWSLLGLFSTRVRDMQLAMTGTADHPLMLSNQAAIESNMGRHDQALVMADRAIQADSTCTQAWYNRGVALIGLRRLADAEEAFRKTIAIDRSLWQPWHNLASVLHSAGKDREANECMQQAVRLRTH